MQRIIPHDEAERLIKMQFGEEETIPKRCYGGPGADPNKAEYSTDDEALYIRDYCNETLWAIGLQTGTMMHRGTGRGRSWTAPRQWFNPAEVRE